MIEVQLAPKQPEPKNPTNGSVFKKKHGYSKTMKRLLKKYGLTIDEYRKVRKARKAKETKVRQKKHADSAAYKRANKKQRQPGGKKKSNESSKNTITENG